MVYVYLHHHFSAWFEQAVKAYVIGGSIYLVREMKKTTESHTNQSPVGEPTTVQVAN